MNKKIYLIPTPIGNLDDISLRAIKKFKELNIFVCEDTRTTRKLFSLLNITYDNKVFISNHRFNEIAKINKILKILETDDIGVVVDAGAPTINDPGYLLIKEAIKSNITIIPLSGPSSIVNTIMGSGIEMKDILFIGFLPKKESEIKKALNHYNGDILKFFFFLSVHQFTKSLEIIQKLYPQNYLSIGKELTKLHETFLRGSAKEILNVHPNPKGEYSVLLELKIIDEKIDIKEILNKIEILRKDGKTNKEIQNELLSEVNNISKKELYNLINK